MPKDELNISGNMVALDEEIDKAIHDTLEGFRSQVVLNEDYMKTSLVKKLRKVSGFGRLYRKLAQNPRRLKVSPIQTEINWVTETMTYKGIRPDITILEPHELRFAPGQILNHRTGRYGSYYSEGASIVFELKHFHVNTKKRAVRNAIWKDLKNIRRLHTILSARSGDKRREPFLNSYLVVFSYAENELWSYWQTLKKHLSEHLQTPEFLTSIYAATPGKVKAFPDLQRRQKARKP